MNAAYLTVLSPAEMIQTKTIASDIFGKLFGEGGKWVVTLAILISAGGALNSTILTGGRIPFAIAGDYPRASWIAKVDPKWGTPLRSLVLNSLWACVLVLWGNFEQLLFFSAFAAWLFFAFVGGSVFILRRQSKGEHFLMNGYPWVPFLFILVSLWLCLTTIQHAPREALMGALLILAGIPVFYFLNGREPVREKELVEMETRP
jgi:APA family basic amino acid/polyamine antiporter